MRTENEVFAEADYDDPCVEVTGHAHTDLAMAAFQLIEADRQAEESAARANHDRYVAIARRRNQPHDGDAKALAALVQQLGYARERVLDDFQILDRMAQAEAGSVGQFEAESAVKAAVDERDAMRKRHEREVQSAENKLNAARYNLNQIARFKREVIELREKRPDLFGTSV